MPRRKPVPEPAVLRRDKKTGAFLVPDAEARRQLDALLASDDADAPHDDAACPEAEEQWRRKLKHTVAKVESARRVMEDRDELLSDRRKLSLDARALAVFIRDTRQTKTDIAHVLGVSTQSLAPRRCPKLDAAMRASRAPDPGMVRGSKDRDGNLEAWEE